MTKAEADERRVIEWLTTAEKGRQWQIEAARKTMRQGPADQGPVYLLNYYAVRYGYDLVLAS
ncbi:MAG: hypothetical protein ABW352_22875 [Polyangiales bacterium]